MPRRQRIATGGYVFHVLNRAVARQKIFGTPKDYAAFEKVLTQALERVPIRLLSVCLMPNHWHLVLWPKRGRDDDLSEFMRWLTVTHTQRWHAAHGTSGSGALYQGRFKSFPIQGDDHFLTVCRYVERNALRANPVIRAEDWQWNSLWHRKQATSPLRLTQWPVEPPRNRVQLVNKAQTEDEVEAIRKAIKRGRPFGDEDWTAVTVARLALQSTVRPRGRPPKM